MKCEFCGNEFSNKTSLNSHQKTAKYCLELRNEQVTLYSCEHCKKGFTKPFHLQRHQEICKTIDTNTLLNLQSIKQENIELKNQHIIYKKEIENKDMIIQQQKLIIEEQKLAIKEFQDDQRKQNKDLTDRIQSLAEKAISKPSTVNKNITTTNQVINNMMPITDEHLQEHVQNLNPLHVQNGASGYAKYALEYPLKDMIVCTDFQRRSCKYKDENGNVVTDPEMTKITKRLFSAIKDRNEELINEYSAELQAKWKTLNTSGPSEMNEEEILDFSSKTNDALEFAMNVLSQKRQVNEMADGMRPELFYGFVRELAAGCYRADK
jgi:hypothetical protein